MSQEGPAQNERTRVTQEHMENSSQRLPMKLRHALQHPAAPCLSAGGVAEILE